MGKHEIQIIRILLEGGLTAFAIILFCMELHKLGLIYGAGWYVWWIVGLSAIAFPVWFLLETGIHISFEGIHTTPQPATQKPVTTDAIRGMITQALYDLKDAEPAPTQDQDEQYQPDITDEDVTVLTTRSVKDV